MYIYQLTQINDQDPTQTKLKEEQYNQMLQGQTNFKNIVSKGWYKQITAEQLPRFSFVVFQIPSENEMPREFVQHIFYNTQIIESTTELSGDNQVPITLYRFVAEYSSETITSFKSVDDLIANGLLTQDNQISFKPQQYMFHSDNSTLSNLFAKHSGSIQQIYTSAKKDYITKDGLAISEYVYAKQPATTQANTQAGTQDAAKSSAQGTASQSGTTQPQQPAPKEPTSPTPPVQKSTPVSFTELPTPKDYVALPKVISEGSQLMFNPPRVVNYTGTLEQQNIQNKVIYVIPGQKVTVNATGTIEGKNQQILNLINTSNIKPGTSQKIQSIDYTYKSDNAQQTLKQYMAIDQDTQSMIQKDGKAVPNPLIIYVQKQEQSLIIGGKSYIQKYDTYLLKQTTDLLLKAGSKDLLQYYCQNLSQPSAEYKQVLSSGVKIYAKQHKVGATSYNDYILVQIGGKDKKSADPSHIIILGVISTTQPTAQEMTSSNTVLNTFFFNQAANTHNQYVIETVKDNTLIYNQSQPSSYISLQSVLRYVIPSITTLTPHTITLPAASFKYNSQTYNMQYRIQVGIFSQNNEYVQFPIL